MLAGPIEDYTFRASTPTEELEVMCRMLTEVGGYASSFADRAHATLARKCGTAQRKVEKELVRREGKAAVEGLFEAPQSLIDASDLTTLSIDELEQLFRQRRKRIETRLAEGRDTSSRFFESRIVNELKHRKSATPLEQLKKDYCLRINRQELDNLSHLTLMPLGNPCTAPGNCKNPKQLEQVIRRLQTPKSVMEREALQAYTDQALDTLKALTPKQEGAALAATLIETGWKGTKVPTWVKDHLTAALKDWQNTPKVPDTDMVLPLLTAYQETQDEHYKRKARRIINRCYKAVTAPDAKYENPSDFIDCMNIATQCCDYVTRFSVRKIRSAWNNFCKNVDVNAATEEKREKMMAIRIELEG